MFPSLESQHKYRFLELGSETSTIKMDDWELSAEELDFLERDALKQLAERNHSSAAATTSNSNSNSNKPNVSSLPASFPSFIAHPPLENNKVPLPFTPDALPLILIQLLRLSL